MLLSLDLAVQLDVSKEDVAHFIEAEFSRADVDRDGAISFAEFERYNGQELNPN